MLVKQQLSKKLKVVMSGIGADELFFGYPTFKQVPLIKNLIKNTNYIPGSKLVLTLVFNALSKILKNPKLKSIYQFSGDLVTAYWIKRANFVPMEIKKCKNFFKIKNCNDLYVKDYIHKLIGRVSSDDKIAISQLESQIYLKNQLLRDSDWASMSHSVELRTPFVDFFLLKEISRYMHYFKNKPNKYYLYNCFKDYLPERIINSKKKQVFQFSL